MLLPQLCLVACSPATRTALRPAARLVHPLEDRPVLHLARHRLSDRVWTPVPAGKEHRHWAVQTQRNSADDFRLKVLVTSLPPRRILGPLSSLTPSHYSFVLKPLYGVYSLLISYEILQGVHCGLCLFCGHSSADTHPFAFSSRGGGHGPLGRG